MWFFRQLSKENIAVFRCRTIMRWFTRLLLVVFAVLSLLVIGLGTQYAPAAQAANNGLGATPYLGWSSWSLTGNHVSGYGNSWLNAAHVEAQSDAMHQKLQTHGFTYINLDAFWYKVSSGVFAVDAYGRWTP